MRIMLAEYSVCTGLGEAIRKEGAAMLYTLKDAFEATGCTVDVPGDFGDGLRRSAGASDCGLVIAPDDLLADYTAAVESACINLGSSSAAVRLCADKLETTRLLLHNGLPAPRVVREGGVRCVVKPRFGCGSEGVFVSDSPVEKEGFISTELIEGEHLSVTLAGGMDRMLPLSLNRQHIRMDRAVEYDGNDVNIEHPAKEAIFRIARATGDMLGCRGLFGVDVVFNGLPYVVDVNPRPTTSIVGVARTIDRSLADLVLLARFGGLPGDVGRTGSCSFTKKDLEAFLRRSA